MTDVDVVTLANIRLAVKLKYLAEKYSENFEDFVDGLFAVNPNAFEVSKDVEGGPDEVEAELQSMVDNLFATRPKAKISVRVSFQPLARGATLTVRGRF